MRLAKINWFQRPGIIYFSRLNRRKFRQSPRSRMRHFRQRKLGQLLRRINGIVAAVILVSNSAAAIRVGPSISLPSLTRAR